MCVYQIRSLCFAILAVLAGMMPHQADAAQECSSWHDASFWNPHQVTGFLGRWLSGGAASGSVDQEIYLVSISECLSKIDDINTMSANGFTPLIVASESASDPRVIELLFDMGAQADLPSSTGTTAIQHAVQLNPNPDIIDVLVAHGSDQFITTNEGATVLSLAAMGNNRSEVFERIIAHGVDPDLPDQFGLVALHYAARVSTSAKAIEVLAYATSQVDVRTDLGMTPLHHAAGYGQPIAVSTLLKLGADPNAQTYDGGWTPVHSAAVDTDVPRIFRLLSEGGADMNFDPPAEVEFSTPLNMMVSVSPARPTWLVKALLESGASPSFRDETGTNALEAAQISSAPEGTVALLDAALKAELKLIEQDCSTVTDNHERLSCFDGQKTAGQSRASNSVKSDGSHWIYEQQTSALDGRSDVWLSVNSKNREPNQIDRLEPATLWFRCMENRTNVLITFNDYTSRDQSVKYRLDDGAVNTIWMETIAGGDVIGIWSGNRAIQFIRSVFGNDTLVVGYETYNKASVEFSFDVSGLRERIGPLALSCQWTP